jgi:hypothetical protein
MEKKGGLLQEATEETEKPRGAFQTPLFASFPPVQANSESENEAEKETARWGESHRGSRSILLVDPDCPAGPTAWTVEWQMTNDQLEKSPLA